MKNNYFILLMLTSLLFSCSNRTTNSELPEIPVDMEQNISLPLSEIAEEITAIELELTDESLINPDRIKRIIVAENDIIVAQMNSIFIFDKDGKFVRSIGSKGQGPGEYNNIRNLALDERNKRLFVNSTRKIICYDLDGNFLRESFPFQQGNVHVYDMNYINNELLTIVDAIGRKDEKGLFNHSVVYRLNDDLQITDSCTIRNTYFEKPGMSIHPYEDYILDGNATVSLYYSDFYFDEQNPAEEVLRDTLYRFENNQLVPDFRLKFKNNGLDGGGKKIIQLFNTYCSSRYIFAVYGNSLNSNYYRFCYDTKTGKGYNMQDGYTDDINGIDKRISIRPFHTNPEMFYYWHTHIKSGDLEEPNPTLYVGQLKK